MENLKFKGKRDYLQGGDIFNSIDIYFSNHYQGFLQSLSFKRFARNQLHLTMVKPTQEKPIANGSWLNFDKKRIPFWLLETDKAVTESYEFEEGLLTNSAVIADNSIKGYKMNSYTVIENVIALTKELNYKLTPIVDGKWVFSQVDLVKRLPEDFENIEIDRVAEISKRFSRNKIIINKQEYGEIRFMVGSP